MPLPIGSQRKEEKMQIRIMLIAVCCLFSCGFFKTSTQSKNKIQSRTNEVLKMQEEISERTSALRAQTFLVNDSSETISMVEILPSSALKFTAATGFSVEANSIRIFTKRKTGKYQSVKLLMSQKKNTDYKTATTSTKENKTATVQQNKVRKAQPFLVLAMVVLGAMLVVMLWRYRKILKLMR